MTKFKSLGIVLLAVLLVGSSIGPIAMSQPAAAQDDSDSCSTASPLTGAGWAYNTFFSDCSDTQDTEFADKLDAYNGAQQTEAHIETALTMAENNVNDAENQAWIEAESAFFEAYTSNATEAEATQAGLDAMESHYATRQSNLIELQNNVLVDLYTTFNETKSFSLPGDESTDEYLIHRNEYYPGVTFEHDADKFSYSLNAQYGWSPEPVDAVLDIQPGSVSTQQKTLADGTSIPVTVFDVRVAPQGYYDGTYMTPSTYGDVNPQTTTFKLIDGEHHTRFYESDSDHTKEVNVYFSKIEANHYPDDYPMETARHSKVTDAERWNDAWTGLTQSLNEQTTEWETFANQSYNDLEAPESDFSADDILSRLTQMNEYSLNLGNENVSFNDAIAGLAASGFSMPDDDSAYMNLTYQTPGGETRTDWGMLMSQQAPPGGWDTSTTYNTTDLPTNPIVVDENGTQRMVKGDLRIDGVYDRNGTQIENPDLESPDRTFQSTNLTDLRQDILNLSAQISAIRNRTATPGAAGGSSGFDASALTAPFNDLQSFLVDMLGVGAELVKWAIIVGLILLALTLLSALA